MRKEKAVFLPPRVDCAANDAPPLAAPELPQMGEGVPSWQLYAYGWQSYAEGVLMQRVETAKCLSRLREVGIIK